MAHDTHSDFVWPIGMLPAGRPLRLLDLVGADHPEVELAVASRRAGERS